MNSSGHVDFCGQTLTTHYFTLVVMQSIATKSLSVSSHVSKTTHLNFAKYSVHVIMVAA